jgi:hypothetical protein
MPTTTLDAIGVTGALLAEGRYDPIRPRYQAMDRATRGREIRNVMAAPREHAEYFRRASPMNPV